MALAWAASPRSLIRYSLLGIVSAAMPPITVYLGATLVNRIAEARAALAPLHATCCRSSSACGWRPRVQRAIGAYMGYGRNLFVRRVQLEAERRLLAQASKVDLGHFDNSDWHDRLARAKRDVSWRPGDLTWSVLGLSGNIVTIVLMASLLASLHYVLVVLALAAAVLSLLLERRVTSQAVRVLLQGDAGGARARVPRRSAGAAAHDEGDSRLRAGRLPARPAQRAVGGSLFQQREQMYRSGTRISLLTGLVTGTTLALAYVFVAHSGRGRHDRSRRRRAGDRRVHRRYRARSATSRARSSPSISTRRFSTTTFRSSRSTPLVPVPATPQPLPDWRIDAIEFDNVTFTYPGRHGAGGRRAEPAHPRRRADRARRRKRRREEHAGQAAAALLRRRIDGAVRVGGVDLKDLDPEALRSRIGVLFQDYASYELSVRENVVMGRPDGDGGRRARDGGAARRAQRLAGEEDAEGPRLEGRPAVRRRPRSVGRRVAAPRARAHHVPRRRHLDSRRTDLVARSRSGSGHLRGAEGEPARAASAS